MVALETIALYSTAAATSTDWSCESTSLTASFTSGSSAHTVSTIASTQKRSEPWSSSQSKPNETTSGR